MLLNNIGGIRQNEKLISSQIYLLTEKYFLRSTEKNSKDYINLAFDSIFPFKNRRKYFLPLNLFLNRRKHKNHPMMIGYQAYN